MWRNGSVLHLQFWFVCKSKSRTLFLTLPSGLIQECSRFINKSGFIMIWSSSLIIQPIKLLVVLSNRIQFESAWLGLNRKKLSTYCRSIVLNCSCIYWYLENWKCGFSEKVFIQFENFDPSSCGVLFFIYCDLHVELRIEHWTAVR